MMIMVLLMKMMMMKIFRVSFLREKPECSPKFIVTLDGVPSPLASLTEHDMDTDHAPSSMTVDPSADHRTKPVQISMTSDLLFDGEGTLSHTHTKTGLD